MFASEISKEELGELPIASFDGKIHIIDSYGSAEIIAKRLSSYPVLGFDTESRPSFAKGKMNHVALLQLATETDAFLFRLCKIDIPMNLIALMSNKNIIKVGAAIKNDIDQLKRSAKLKPDGFVDLQNVMHNYNINDISLTKMAGIILGARVAKSQQLSNWENNVLSPAQQRYAATDAWICYMIYKKLSELT